MRREALIECLWRKPALPWEAVLWPLSLFGAAYGAVMRARRAGYEAGLLRAESLAVPVIAIGNLVAGGTGKTPMTIFLAQAFMARGRRVGILARGYRGSHEGKGALLVSDGVSILSTPEVAGDEPILMARALPGVPVAVSSRRIDGGRMLEQAGVDLVLLDDGFQHLALVRDADVVVVDGQAPFGNGRMLPRGPLREPPGALRRADLVAVRLDGGMTCAADLGRYTAAPVMPVRTGVTQVTDGAGRSVSLKAGERLFAVCGIGRPERFLRTLRETGVTVAGHDAFSDHAVYGAAEVAEIRAQAGASGAACVVTTAKDGVKLAPLWPDPASLKVLHIELKPDGGASARVDALLATASERFEKRRQRSSKSG